MIFVWTALVRVMTNFSVKFHSFHCCLEHDIPHFPPSIIDSSGNEDFEEFPNGIARNQGTNIFQTEGQTGSGFPPLVPGSIRDQSSHFIIDWRRNL